MLLDSYVTSRQDSVEPRLSVEGVDGSLTAPPRASTQTAKSDHVKVSPFRPVWFHARVWIDFVDRYGIPRGTTRSASSVHRHRAILDPSERQQAPKTINHGQRQRCATSICLSQPAHAPHPTRPRNRGASARVLPRDCARVREYPAWRQPAMQPGLRAPGPDRSPTPTRPAPRRPDGEVRSRVRSHAQGVRALGLRALSLNSRLLHTSHNRAPRPSWQDSHHA